MKALLLSALCLLASNANAVDFKSGETLDFDLEFLSISAGNAQMTIGPRSGDMSRLWITSTAESTAGFSRIYRVRDELESVVTAKNFSTVYYRKQLQEGSKSKDETTTIDPRTGIATRKGQQTAVPTPVFDPLSILFYLRNLDLAEGRSFKLPVCADGKFYTIDADVSGRERITTPMGTFDALVVVPRSEMSGGVFRDEKGKMTIWYSADDRHLPLRIKSELKFGSITATLKAVTSGVPTSSK